MPHYLKSKRFEIPAHGSVIVTATVTAGRIQSGGFQNQGFQKEMFLSQAFVTEAGQFFCQVVNNSKGRTEGEIWVVNDAPADVTIQVQDR
jgi:molybdopterin/thiamine biosynthesis adenylyltransferase